MCRYNSQNSGLQSTHFGVKPLQPRDFNHHSQPSPSPAPLFPHLLNKTVTLLPTVQFLAQSRLPAKAVREESWGPSFGGSQFCILRVILE